MRKEDAGMDILGLMTIGLKGFVILLGFCAGSIGFVAVFAIVVKFFDWLYKAIVGEEE